MIFSLQYDKVVKLDVYSFLNHLYVYLRSGNTKHRCNKLSSQIFCVFADIYIYIYIELVDVKSANHWIFSFITNSFEQVAPLSSDKIEDN